MDNELVPSLKDTIWGYASDITQDILEIGLDAVTENEVIKEIPIVGTVVKLGNAVVAIRDRHLLKKTLIFVSEVNNGTISKEKLEKHKKKLEKEPSKMKIELEHILLLLDRINRSSKAIVLANFYKAYMNEDIKFDWDDFCICAELLENFSMHDIDTLKEIHDKKKYIEGDRFDIFALQKLSGLGLVNYFNGMLVASNGTENSFATSNTIGDIFYELGFQESLEIVKTINEKGVF